MRHLILIAAALGLGFAACPAQAQEAGHEHAHHGEMSSADPAHQHDAEHYLTERHARHTLEELIAELKAGTPNYERMSTELADAVRPQAEQTAQGLTALGDVTQIEHVQEIQPGANLYRVTFASGQALSWTIVIDGENTIIGLLIQP